jgi:hypothetical protein
MSKPQGLVQPEGLGKLKKVIHLIGSRTRDLQACSIVRVYKSISLEGVTPTQKAGRFTVPTERFSDVTELESSAMRRRVYLYYAARSAEWHEGYHVLILKGFGRARSWP